MADKKQMDTSKIDALYSWLSYDLKKLKGELLNEMKYASVQTGALYQELKADKDKSAQAMSQEIRYSYKQNQTIYDGITTMLTEEVAPRLESTDDKAAAIKAIVEEISQSVSALKNADEEAISELVKEKVASLFPSMQESLDEIKYGYMQQQAVYDGLAALISGEVVAKLDDMQAKLSAVEQIDAALTQIQEKLAELITLYEDNDYKAVIEGVADKTEECIAEHSRQVLDAVAAIPVAENVDYTRIVDEVGDKVMEVLGEVLLPEPQEEKEVKAIVDYDKIAYGTAEKVIESLPYPEKVDYRRIDDSFQKAAEKLSVQVNEDAIAAAVSEAVAKAVAALDMDKLADMVAEKIVAPTVAPEIDYDLLSDMVAEKLSAKQSDSYDVVLDENGIDMIAEKVCEKLNAGEEVEVEEPTYELVIDDDGIDAIAAKVAEELCARCVGCEEVEETVEEVVEEQPVEEVVEEVVEEQPVEEVVEEVVEEQPVEEVAPATEEIAVAEPPVLSEDELVDAETGLVIRLKRSFTAKLKQSEEEVKQYYSDVKNELKSYERINSNVSWHGDRFNYGRDTVAKLNICGKTLCLYLALDPEDEEFKQTVYHQKNVGGQKAYENTPFMVKIKSGVAAKKAVRLVGYLAEKLGAVKDADFAEVNYVDEYAYQSTKELFDEGFIKATKEKKVELDF